jgi:hypothetical protein
MSDLEVLHEDLDVSVPSIAFDPNGRFGSYDVGGPTGTVVVTLPDGDVRVLGGQGPRGLWTSSGRLITSEAGDAVLFELDGTEVDRWPGAGTLGLGSDDGSTFLFTWSNDDAVTIIRDGASMEIEMPGKDCSTLSISQDGDGLAAVCLSPDGDRDAYVMLL